MKRLGNGLACLLLAGLSSGQIFAADIVYVHQNRGGGGSLAWEDDQWRALLEGAGHTIVAHEAFDNFDVDESGLDVLNASDIVIFSRDTNSGDYNEPIEQELWTEGVTVPMIVMTPFTVRSNRWDMALSTAILETDKDASAVGPLIAYEPDHPIFTGVLDENNEALIFDEEALGPDDSIDFLNDFDDGGMLGNGTVLGIESEFEVPWIVYWEAEQEFYNGSLYQAGGPRLYYTIGSDDDPNTWGEKNTLPAGDQILLNAIAWMTGEDINQGVVGDFNGNGTLDIEDINQLTAASAAASGDGKFDLNGDSAVNVADVTAWIKDRKNSWIGDANLDGEFNSGDFVVVFGAGKFEQEVDAVWADGDWNGDGRFNSGDFVAAFTDGGYELGPRTGVSAVPEPASSVLVLVGIFGLLSVRRRRS